MINSFSKIFKHLQIPVIVCENSENLPLINLNMSAKILLFPTLTTKSLEKDNISNYNLSDILRFKKAEDYDTFISSVNATGSVDSIRTELITYDNKDFQASLSAGIIDCHNSEYFIIYIYAEGHILDSNTLISTVFNAAYSFEEIDVTINKILAIVGKYVNVSRVYIFEEISAQMTANTYEWCAEGVEPAINDLQNLEKKDYNYDSIVESGVYITDDVRTLPDNDREIVEAQGIKSLAILSLNLSDKPLGYIGFDDCVDYRKWSSQEIEVLKSITKIIVSLISRRNSEEKTRRSFEVLQTISDNMDNIVYVNNLDKFELIFINKTLTRILEKDAEDILGQKCWQVLQKGMTDICDFCPLKIMVDKDGNILKEEYVWEFQNTLTGKWYLIKDSLIKWIDDSNVHIETAIEITHQKKYEAKLEYYASIDMMTGAFNREWGYKIINNLRAKSNNDFSTVSLCFLDLDGLKLVNDTYGHDAGDSMIIQIVAAINSCCRKSDILCRWGGDEFILLLECDTADAEVILENITNKLKRINDSKINSFELSFSYGITPITKEYVETTDSIISHADKLMYANKMKKRNPV